MINFSISGTLDMLKKIQKINAYSPSEFGRALAKETDIEVLECKRQSPVESHDMQREIHREGPFIEGRRIWCEIQTGEKSIDYALKQHEDLDLFHSVGNAKFIEGPIKESAPSMGKRVAARIDLNKAL